MIKRQPPFAKSSSASGMILAADLKVHVESWLLACDISQQSNRTIGSRRDVLNKLIWFLNEKNIETVGTQQLRQFFLYVGRGHTEPGGRWGNPRQTKPVSSGTVKTYHSILRTFFTWLETEGEISASPMHRIPPPVDRPDQIEPFNNQQLNAILAAAKKSNHPRRDEALLLFLLDTGVRASEASELLCKQINLQSGTATVMGKGHKTRVVPYSRETKRALYKYLNEREQDPETAVFLSDRGVTAGEGLTRHGLRMAILRLGTSAGIKGVRISPHTFRHTFAISFLRAGGNVFTLQQMLGHTNLAMTNRYVAIAQADIAKQHMMCSPVAQLKGRHNGS